VKLWQLPALQVYVVSDRYLMQSGVKHVQGPRVGVPHSVPSVLRAQPDVSVSVEPLDPQVPALHVKVVTLRVRLPELSHVAA
jgi:hypothetical protein